MKISKHRIIALALIFALGLWSSPPARGAEPVPGNLIANPDMQIGDETAPENWELAGFSDEFTGAYPVAGPEEGDKAAQITTTVHTDGDAKWVFDSVEVSAGARYIFKNSYLSDVPTQLVAAFAATGEAEPSLFTTLVTLPATGEEWQAVSQDFTVPLGYDAVTVYHLIAAVGTLTTANYSLVLSVSAAENLFPEGMVSLTFDDGWSTQYDNALPILKDAGLPATFFMISQALAEADAITADNLISEAHPDVIETIEADSVTWSNIFTDPSNKTYRFSSFYTATSTVAAEVTYQLEGEEPVTVPIGTLAASPGLSRASLIFTLPGNPTDTVTPIAVSLGSAGAELTVSSPELRRYFIYMDSSQLLDLQTEGNEIGNHTVKHCNLVTGLCPDSATPEAPNPLTAEEEIGQARTALLAAGVDPLDTLAYPYGAQDETIQALVEAAEHDAARTVSPGFNTRHDNPYALKAQVVAADTSLDQVFDWIDEAVANKWWLVLVFHQVEDQAIIDASGHTGAITPETLTGITNYLQDVPVKTFREGAALMVAATPDDPGPPPGEDPDDDPPASSGGGGGIVGAATIPLELEAIGVPLIILPQQIGRIEVNLDLNQLEIRWPLNALETKATVVAELGSQNVGQTADRIPSEAELIDNAIFRVRASNFESSNPFTGTDEPFTASLNAPIPGDMATIGVYRLDETAGRWMRVSDVNFDAAAGVTTFSSDQLGVFAIFSVPGLPASLAAVGEIDNTPPLDEEETPPEDETPSEGESFAEYVAAEQALVIIHDQALATRLAGRILLQVEEQGQAWYVSPIDSHKYFLGRPNDAFTIMRRLSLGISNSDWDSYEDNKAPRRLAGRILLKVEDFGRAYYVNPLDLEMHYLGRPADAFALMRQFGLGITNRDLRQIWVGELE